jgi:hypothetical protein
MLTQAAAAPLPQKAGARVREHSLIEEEDADGREPKQMRISHRSLKGCAVIDKFRTATGSRPHKLRAVTQWNARETGCESGTIGRAVYCAGWRGGV